MARAVGGIPANLHQGSRSEYLAQYVFSMFGASVLVPRQEDYGIDLYCTLFSERDGQLVWPDAYFSVQIKSKPDPWVFPDSRSVRFLAEYPSPLLLCVVDKSEGRLRIYQTIARFGAAVAAQLPDNITLVPDGRGSGLPFGVYGVDPETGDYLLGPPILDFKVEDLLNDDQFNAFRNVLHFWVLQDFNNVQRYHLGLHSVWMPQQYNTNEVPTSPPMIFFLTYPSPELAAKAEDSAAELLEWLAGARVSSGDYLGSLLAALMLRQRDPRQRLPVVALDRLLKETQISTATGANQYDSVFSLLDKLLSELRDKLQPANQADDVRNEG